MNTPTAKGFLWIVVFGIVLFFLMSVFARIEDIYTARMFSNLLIGKERHLVLYTDHGEKILDLKGKMSVIMEHGAIRINMNGREWLINGTFMVHDIGDHEGMGVIKNAE